MIQLGTLYFIIWSYDKFDIKCYKIQSLRLTVLKEIICWGKWNASITFKICIIPTFFVKYSRLENVAPSYRLIWLELECIAKWCLISQYVMTTLPKAVKQDDRSLVWETWPLLVNWGYDENKQKHSFTSTPLLII